MSLTDVLAIFIELTLLALTALAFLASICIPVVLLVLLILIMIKSKIVCKNSSVR
jgi:hypothetical protein